MKKLVYLGSVTVLVLATSACSANLCQRKDRAMASKCAGTSVAYNADPLCEQKISTCNEGQLAQMEGYVRCLEAQNECSLDSLSQCASQYPGGVNLQCSGAFQ